MRELPSGTVTFLFTDIEGSTSLLHKLGTQRYSAALAEHRALLRAAFAAHGGAEVDTQGDAFLVAFSSAAAAVRAAADAQRALASGAVRVRMGIHTGSPQLTTEGYVGPDLHLGARIAAAGHGGQVLLSGATQALVDEALTDLGEHRVKDFGEPVWIYQLGSDRFPPLRTISNSNLPRPASSFVGREQDVVAIRRMVTDGARLLTLTGPGGTGKTRLAIEAAVELLPDFRNGVFWVDLAAVRDPALVLPSIERTIGADTDLATHVGEREMLLLLDNLEQVAAAGADVAQVVERCPRVRVIQTSRELLRVKGEVEYRVAPLPLADAASLFAERSGITADATVVELCRRLDSLPLAVELAAGRSSVLSPAQILERMAKRLDLLRGGRDADARQQTLRATIEWSHDLLDDAERSLFAGLSVFSAGFTLEAAEHVCAADLDTLQSLVDKSLVRFADERFSMLETIRAYGGERLAASGEEAEMRARHAGYYLALAEQAEPHILGAQPASWLNRLEREHANIRAAFDWLDASGDTHRAMRMGGALWEFWCLRAHYTEGGRRLAALIAADDAPTLARAKALTGVVHLGYEDERIDDWLAESRALFAAHGDQWGMAFAEYQRAMRLTDTGEFAAAAPILKRSAARLQEVGDEHRALLAMRVLAWCYEELGDEARQREITHEVLRRARASDDRMMEARALAVLAGIASNEGRPDDALAMLARAHELDTELGDPDELNINLVRFARVLALAGRARTAVRLVAVREATRPDVESGDTQWVVRMKGEALDAARAALGDAAFDEAWAEGARMTADAAVAEALEGRAIAPDVPA